MDRVKEYIDEGSSLLEEWKQRMTRNRSSSNRPFDESKLRPGDTVSQEQDTDGGGAGLVFHTVKHQQASQ